MTKELQDLITKAGLVITVATAGGVGGYFISDKAPTEVITYSWSEIQVAKDLWNALLEEKYANCEIEPDCIITDGVPGVTFEGIPIDEVPNKLNEKLKDYNIKVEKIK